MTPVFRKGAGRSSLEYPSGMRSARLFSLGGVRVAPGMIRQGRGVVNQADPV